MEAHHPFIADALAAAAKDLQFGRILQLIKSTHSETSREDQA
jgi:hypothetical protein